MVCWCWLVQIPIWPWPKMRNAQKHQSWSLIILFPLSDRPQVVYPRFPHKPGAYINIYISIHIHIYTFTFIKYYIIYMVAGQNCAWNVPRCSGRKERRGFVTGLVPDLWSVIKYRLYMYIYMYIYIYICVYIYICKLYICNVYNIHPKDMHVEATSRWLPLIFTSHLHDILVVHLFNAGLPCMASGPALDRTQPVASVTHWLPCEAVWEPSRSAAGMERYGTGSGTKRPTPAPPRSTSKMAVWSQNSAANNA